MSLASKNERITGSASSTSTTDDSEKERLRKELEDAQNMIKALQLQLNAQKEIPSKVPQQTSGGHGSEGNEEVKVAARFVKAERKEVGVSYDSSKMRSTLAHIDVEEMCRCLSKAVQKHILHAHDVLQVRETAVTSDQTRVSLNSLPEFLEGEQEEEKQEAGEIKVPKAAEQLFIEQFGDEKATPGRIPDETQIYYYCKNILLKCRMEKECSVVCLIYIERLINKTGLYITETTWKKLLFISLLLASKVEYRQVWDDESYENVHIARVFTLYQLRSINDMERVFLGFVDYDVHVLGSEYAKYYFILRTYSEKNNRSFPLRPLDVDTVRQLQSKSHKAEDILRSMHEKGGPITL